jgi:hypothetical protein
MLSKILPIYQSKVGIELNSGHKCSYQHSRDKILLNLKVLRFNETHFKQDLEKWLGFKFDSFKNFIVFCLLHELGHRQRFLYKKFDGFYYQLQLANLKTKYTPGTYSWRKNYWEKIDEENFAMNYAKKYFKKYIALGREARIDPDNRQEVTRPEVVEC